MEVLCEEREHGPCDGAVLAYVIEGGRGRIAVLCECHRESREDVAVREWGELVFPAARTEEIVRLHRAYHDAKRSFVQRFDEGAKCCAEAGGCSGGVTSYYFSSGETRMLCESHAKGSHALMTERYYDEVYDKWSDLSLAWGSAMAESRAAALAAKK